MYEVYKFNLKTVWAQYLKYLSLTVDNNKSIKYKYHYISKS